MQYRQLKNPMYLKSEAREVLGKSGKEREGVLKYLMNKENDPESIGVMFGGINKKLGLEGKEVTVKEFNRMVFNYNPIDGSKMLKNTGSEKNRKGGEPVFTVPKSVSIIYESASDELRKAIIEKCDRANNEGMDTIKTQLKYRDQSKGMTRYMEAQNISYIRFRHGDNRNGDMNLHYHNALQHYVEGVNGKFYSKEDKAVYQDFDKSQVAFSNAVARGMKELGFEIEKTKGFDWDIKGISKEAIKEYSSRTNDIEKYMKQHPNASIEQAKMATRKDKSNEALSDKEVVWKKELDKKYGINEGFVNSLRTKDNNKSMSFTAKHVLECIGERKKNAFFTSKDVDNALNYLSTFDKKINKISLRKEIFSKDSIHSEKANKKDKSGQEKYINKHFKGVEFKKEWDKSRGNLNKARAEISKADVKAISSKYAFNKKSKVFEKEGIEKGGLADTLNKIREKAEGKKSPLDVKAKQKDDDKNSSDFKPIEISIKGSVAKVEDKKQFSNDENKTSNGNKLGGVSMGGSGVLGIRMKAGELNNKLGELLAQLGSVGHDLTKYFELISQILNVKLQLEATLEQLAKEEAKDLEKYQEQFKQNDYSMDR